LIIINAFIGNSSKMPRPIGNVPVSPAPDEYGKQGILGYD